MNIIFVYSLLVEVQIMSLSFVASQIYLLPVTIIIICIFIEFFTPRITKYKLICGSGLNEMHKTSLYLIAHM